MEEWKMRTFEYVNGRVTPGISTLEDKKHGRIVYLGDTNSKPKRISLDKKSPAVINRHGRIENAWPKSIDFENRRGKFTVLTKPIRGGNGILVRVNTATQSVKSIINNATANGEWSVRSGDPMVIAQADGRRINTGVIYCDDIIQLKPGDAILVKPEGEEIEHVIQNDHGRMRFTPGRDSESENGVDGNIKPEDELVEKEE
jgi:hypothetical protein